MARKRMIDPGFWTDEEVGAWSFEGRLFFLGLLNFADDDGRIKANSKLLGAQIFPYNKEVPVDNLKHEVSKKVVWYTVNDVEYGFIRKFSDHQAISHPQKSKFPAPPKSLLEHSRNGHGALSERSSTINQIKSIKSINRIK